METERTFSQNIPAVLFVTAAILLIPFVAMQFTEEVNWSASDFIIMGAIIFTVGTSFAYVLSKGANLMYKAGVVVAFGTTFFLIWSNLAVGIIGSGPNFANLSMRIFEKGTLIGSSGDCILAPMCGVPTPPPPKPPQPQD